MRGRGFGAVRRWKRSELRCSTRSEAGTRPILLHSGAKKAIAVLGRRAEDAVEPLAAKGRKSR